MKHGTALASFSTLSIHGCGVSVQAATAMPSMVPCSLSPHTTLGYLGVRTGIMLLSEKRPSVGGFSVLMKEG